MTTIPLLPATPKQPLWPAQRLYRPFVLAALAIALILGFGTGVTLLLLPLFGLHPGVQYVTLSQAHGAAQLFGWGGLFGMGLGYHVIPRFRNVRPLFPWPHYATLILVVSGVLLRYAGQAFFAVGFAPGMLLGSGVSLLAGVSVFVGMTLYALSHGNSRRTPGEPWLWAACVWALAAAGLHLAVTMQMAARHAFAPSAAWDAAFVHAALLGFLGNEIFGVGLRTLTAFMSLPPVRAKLVWPSWAIFNAGVAWYVLAQLLGVGPEWTAVGLAFEVVGLILLVLALRVFARRAKKPPYVQGIYVRYEGFLRTAYGWLLTGAVLSLVHQISLSFPALAFPAFVNAPTLHVLTLGFLSMVIMGMAARMLPIFEGAQLPYPRLMDAAFVALNGSVALRIGFGLVSTRATTAGLAISGALGLLALALFAIVVIGVLRPQARETYRRSMAARLEQRQQGVTFVRPGPQPPKPGAQGH